MNLRTSAQHQAIQRPRFKGFTEAQAQDVKDMLGVAPAELPEPKTEDSVSMIVDAFEPTNLPADQQEEIQGLRLDELSGHLSDREVALAIRRQDELEGMMASFLKNITTIAPEDSLSPAYAVENRKQRLLIFLNAIRDSRFYIPSDTLWTLVKQSILKFKFLEQYYQEPSR